jgi:uncharacterized protein YidB (DUF937 family)
MASSRMIALLGLLAVDGYQNRDKISDFLGRMGGQGDDDRDRAESGGGLGGLLGGLLGGGSAGGGGLGGLLGGSVGGTLSGGLGDLIDHFTGKGQGEVAKSWVETGPNREVGTGDLEQALGEDTIGALTQQTGLSREELLARLKTVLPAAVDRLTPAGRLPSEDEASRLLGSSS